MGKRRKVPEDLMGSILGEAAPASSREQTSRKPRQDGHNRSEPTPSAASEPITWELHPQRTGTTFNLSTQVNRELDRLRLELQLEEDIRSSKSEIAEIALQIAIEDVRSKGTESELLKRLGGNYRRL